MANSFMGRCGVDCEACDYRVKTGCPGCPATDGKPFWGECELAMCSISKGLDHCGQCPDIPCDKLKEWSYDPGEHGDNGERIRNAEAWNKKGYDAWLQEKHQQ